VLWTNWIDVDDGKTRAEKIRSRQLTNHQVYQDDRNETAV
jgi:hypothetical protein